MPKIPISEGMLIFLLLFFGIDFSITVVWSLKHLPFSKQGKELVVSGPYAWSRHPFYSAFIWSGTGIVILLFKSWVLLFFVIPVSIYWAWQIESEEQFLLENFGDKYQEKLIDCNEKMEIINKNLESYL